MRIIIILLVMVFVYILVKSIMAKNTRKSKNNMKDIKYCKYCDSYVTIDELCTLKNMNYKKCKNYK
mgnify:FL=1